MKKQVISKLGQFLKRRKIKNYEIDINNLYNKDLLNKEWIEHSKDIMDLEAELIVKCNQSYGKEKSNFLCYLQALYNTKFNEINHLRNHISSLDSKELAHFFNTKYLKINEYIESLSFDNAVKISASASKSLKKEVFYNNLGLYVSSKLTLYAIGTVFKDEFNETIDSINGL